MSNSILEEQRILHSDIERSARTIVYELLNKSKSQKRKIYQEHRILDELEEIQNKCRKLIEIYQDNDEMRKKEIDEMIDPTSLQRTIAKFDEKEKELRSYEKNSIDIIDEKLIDESKQKLVHEVIQTEQLEKIKFKGAECYGKYLDLTEIYQFYINIKNVTFIDYITYLETFSNFNENLKGNQYKKYLYLLFNYLKDFYKRSFPLSDFIIELKQPSLEELKESILKYIQVLESVIEDTKKNEEKKQTRTWEENQLEIEKLEEMEWNEIKKEEDPEDEKIKNLNPLNIPLGFDGKPIPYWLYKLNGLGIEYKCEICGDYSYWGPRAFEKHFQEFRHSNAMRCLKIPNTRHFHHITSIQEAINLWKKIKTEMNKTQWDKEQEEYEDKDGNVFNKKTFKDLQRQGIIEK